MQAEMAEDWIRSHLQILTRFLNCFVGDGAVALRLAEQVFREVIDAGPVSGQALFRTACATLSRWPRRESGMGGLDKESALCWLLKDLAGLRYKEIADVLNLEQHQVRQHIASARAAVLTAL
jgi:DNA-directed RNA polymerase specialized sigma24 family protein